MNNNSMNNLAELDALRAKMEELNGVTENMADLIRKKQDDDRYNSEVLFALDFVDFAKKLYYKDCNYSYYDYIKYNMDRYKEGQVQSRAVRLIDDRNA